MSDEWHSKVCQLCNQELSGRGVWKYCSDYCRNEAKRQRNQKDYAQSQEKEDEWYRKYRREVIKRSRSRSYYCVTKRKLRPLLDHIEKLQEEYACKDDCFQDVWAMIDNILEMIVNPDGRLEDAAKDARNELNEVDLSLQAKQEAFGHNSDFRLLRVCAMGLDRDIGSKYSPKTLHRLSGKAIRVRKLLFEQKEIPGFIQALLSHVEIQRTRYFATTEMEYLESAEQWLARAESACDLSLTRAKGELKKRLEYLRAYIALLQARLVFDAGKADQVEPYIQTIQKKAADFKETDSTAEEIAHIQLLTAMMVGEHELHERKLDIVEGQVKGAECIFPTMHYHSLETRFRLTWVKTASALLRDDPEYQQYLQNLMSLFDRFPSFEFRHYFEQLKRIKSRYSKKLSSVNLPMDKPMFVDLCYTHLVPFIMPGIRVKVCGEEVHP